MITMRELYCQTLRERPVTPKLADVLSQRVPLVTPTTIQTYRMVGYLETACASLSVNCLRNSVSSRCARLAQPTGSGR